MDITPLTHFLESIRHDKGSWVVLSAEGIDNSLDAGATKVAVRLESGGVSIEDNGIGITKVNQKALVTLGDHRPHGTTVLGRFGMGFKYNAISAGNELLIESSSRDGRMRLFADWRRVSQSGRWDIPDPVWVPLTIVGASTGTTVTINELRWKRPEDRDVERAREQLAQQFFPALANGIELSINGLRLPVLPEPMMSDMVEQQIQLPNGKGAHVRGGYLVAPGPLSRVQLTYKHRVIEPNSTFGCGVYSGISHMFARVELTGTWGLSRFKDEVLDDDRAALQAAVHAVLLPILEKCHSTQMDLVVNEMTDRLNEMLPPEMQTTRPARKNPRGRKNPKPKPSKQRGHTKDESPVPNGPTLQATSPQKKLLITFEPGLVEKHGYGDVKPGTPIRIELARDNPDIEAWLALRDQSVGQRILFTTAIMLYEHYKEIAPGQQQLNFGDQSFGWRVWNTRQLQPATFIDKQSR